MTGAIVRDYSRFASLITYNLSVCTRLNLSFLVLISFFVSKFFRLLAGEKQVVSAKMLLSFASTVSHVAVSGMRR